MKVPFWNKRIGRRVPHSLGRVATGVHLGYGHTVENISWGMRWETERAGGTVRKKNRLWRGVMKRAKNNFKGKGQVRKRCPAHCRNHASRTSTPKDRIRIKKEATSGDSKEKNSEKRTKKEEGGGGARAGRMKKNIHKSLPKKFYPSYGKENKRGSHGYKRGGMKQRGPKGFRSFRRRLGVEGPMRSGETDSHRDKREGSQRGEPRKGKKKRVRERERNRVISIIPAEKCSLVISKRKRRGSGVGVGAGSTKGTVIPPLDAQCHRGTKERLK